MKYVIYKKDTVVRREQFFPMVEPRLALIKMDNITPETRTGTSWGVIDEVLEDDIKEENYFKKGIALILTRKDIIFEAEDDESAKLLYEINRGI